MTTLAPELTLPELARMMRELIQHDGYESTRLGSAVKQYLAWAQYGLAARSLMIYEPLLAALCVFVAAEDPGPDGVTEDMLLGCLATISPGQRRLAKTAWSGFFKWASHPKRRLCAYNLVTDLPAIKEPSTKVYDIFSLAEQARLVKATDSMPLPWVHRLRVRCVIDTGARNEELRRLRVRDFDLHERVVVVLGKGSKERLVPFGDDLFKALIQYRNRPLPAVEQFDKGGRFLEERKPLEDDYIFFPYGVTAGQVGWTRPWKPLAARALGYWWERRITERANVRYRSLHMARHTVATNLVDAEADAYTVKEWLGHADLRAGEVYVHNSRSRLQRGRGKLDDYRKGQTG